jgi:histone H3/H4
MDINQILNEICDDVTISENDLKNIQNNTEKYLKNELEKIHIQLKKSIVDFTKEEVNKLKRSKLENINNKINNIVEDILIKTSEHYNLDQDEVLQNNKVNLLTLDTFNEHVNEPVNEVVDEPVNKVVNEPVNEVVNEPVNEVVNEPVNEPVNEVVDEPVNEVVNEPVNEVVNDEPKSCEKPKSKKVSNEDYKNKLISENKCPVIVKNKFCEKKAKHGCYCGYHKKYNV